MFSAKDMATVGVMAGGAALLYTNIDRVQSLGDSLLSSGGSMVPTFTSAEAATSLARSSDGFGWTGTACGWHRWTDNAETWLNKMGYEPAKLKNQCSWNMLQKAWPKDVIVQAIKTDPNIYYHLAHGSYRSVQAPDSKWIRPHEIKQSDRMGRFAFLGSCGMFNSAPPGQRTWVDAFADNYEVVVGFAQIAGSKPIMSKIANLTEEIGDNWQSATFQWQDKMFRLLHEGETVGDACRRAALEYDPAYPWSDFMEDHYGIAGDPSVRLVGGGTGG